MPKVEIDEADLQQYTGLANIVNQMLTHKDARRHLLEARKITAPNVAIPELDAASPFEEQFKSLREEMAKDREDREKARAEAESAAAVAKLERKLDEQRGRLRQQGWTADGIAEIEKHAEATGVADLEIAAAHYEKLHPPAEPIAPNGQGQWGWFEDEGKPDEFVQKMVESRGKDDAALMREARLAIQEVRQQAQRR